MREVLDELEELEEAVDSDEEQAEVADVRRAVERLPGSTFLGERIERYTTRDVAESFVGGVLVSLPLLVEDGVLDIADHFLDSTVAGLPVWLFGNLAFIAVMTWGLLYWADFREVWNARPIFGIVPRRLLGVLSISLVTATLTMTLWGRVSWSEPLVAFARVSVVWTAAAFGAALGDILPGESDGHDLPGPRGQQEASPDGGRVRQRGRSDHGFGSSRRARSGHDAGSSRRARSGRGSGSSRHVRLNRSSSDPGVGQDEKGTRLVSGRQDSTMPFVTRLTFRSGDGDRLDSVVSELKARAERKGVELRGPHAEPPSQYSVPQHRGIGQGTFDPWQYTVYTRVLEVVDHNEFARQLAEREYPASIHVTADVEQFSQVGDR
jgi:ribosomal protein S10/uncharacterized membrane protein